MKEKKKEVKDKKKSIRHSEVCNARMEAFFCAALQECILEKRRRLKGELLQDTRRLQQNQYCGAKNWTMDQILQLKEMASTICVEKQYPIQAAAKRIARSEGWLQSSQRMEGGKRVKSIQTPAPGDTQTCSFERRRNDFWGALTMILLNLEDLEQLTKTHLLSCRAYRFRLDITFQERKTSH